MTVLSISYPKNKTDLKKIKALKKNYDQLLLDLNAVEPKKLQLTSPNIQQRLNRDSASLSTQFSQIIVRSYKEKIRDLAPLKFRLLQMGLLSILSIGLFWKIPRSNFGEMLNYIGFVFYCVCIQLFVGLLSSILDYVEERPLFLREYAGRFYGVVPYYLAKDIIEMPITLILPLIFSCFYFGMGTDVTMEQFGYFYFIQVMVVIGTAAYGQVIGALFDSAESACGIAPVLMTPFMLFAGFLTNVDTYPRWIAWFQYLSPIRYGFEAAMHNEFDNFHELPIYVPNPIKFLNFHLGFTKCMILMVVTTYVMKVLACFMLKAFMKKFQ